MTNSGAQGFFDNIRALIKGDELDKALALLDARLRGTDRDLVNEAIVLVADFNSLRAQQRRGLVSDETFEVKSARLTYRTLEFVDFLESRLSAKDLPFPLTAVSLQPPAETGLEKVFGANHLKSIAWLQRGLLAAASVCRVLTPDGLGTGFLIGENRLMTNHHVIPSQELATKSRAEFNFQLTLNGEPERSYMYGLQAASLKTSRTLDYSVIEVSESPGSPALAAWGKVELDPGAAPGLGDHVVIIQHPQGGPKQIAVTANQVVNIFEHRLKYTTDTLPGSSGSPVFNDNWRVIALHHAGGNLVINERGDRMFANEGILMQHVLSDLNGAKAG